MREICRNCGELTQPCNSLDEVLECQNMDPNVREELRLSTLADLKREIREMNPEEREQFRMSLNFIIEAQG